MNFVDFVEKYLSCKLSDVEEHHLCAMVYGVLSEEHFDKHFFMAIEYLQDPDFLQPTSKIWHTING